MKAFIISPVKNIEVKDIVRIKEFIETLKKKGFTKIHFPFEDTNQTLSELEICTQNKNAILESDEVFIYYQKDSIGSIFDLGVAFGANKKITIINKGNYAVLNTKEKSFSNLLLQLK